MSAGSPFHATVSMPGISQDCLFNDHPMCKGCGCTCHKKKAAAQVKAAEAEVVETHSTGVVGGEVSGRMVCPQCGDKRPDGEKFCRRDGTKLLSLSCWACGEIYMPADKYCWNCGHDLYAPVAGVNTPPTVAAPAAAPAAPAQSEARTLQTEPRRRFAAPAAPAEYDEPTTTAVIPVNQEGRMSAQPSTAILPAPTKVDISKWGKR